MAWSAHDNKHYRGKLDRICVSETEKWEVDYFVGHYVRNAGRPTTDDNKAQVGAALESYPGHKPWKRADLERHVRDMLGW